MFVTDALLRKSVVVCQSLGRRGIDVTCGSSTRLSPAFFSRYCKNRVIYPAPETQPEAFVEMMLDYLRKERHDVLFPTDDVTLKLISRYHDDFEKLTHVPIPTPDQVVYGLDKARAMQIANMLGIPHPRTVFPTSAEDAESLVQDLSPSLVVKPRGSSGGRGIVYVDASESVGAVWQRVHEQFPYPLIQERIVTGAKYDVCVIMDRKNQPVASFAQKELRHFPVKDGLSTMQESVWRPDLVERSIALLQAIGWYGVAEIEFAEDVETGETLLLEVNPRFWASVQLAISCGIDFPYLLYQIARGQSVTPVHTYTVGRRCRWLVPGDMFHYAANPNRAQLDPPFFQFRGADTVYDGLYRDDPGATLGVLLSCGHYLFDAEMWRLLLRGKRGTAKTTAAPQANSGSVVEQREETCGEGLLFDRPVMEMNSWVVAEPSVERRDHCKVDR